MDAATRYAQELSKTMYDPLPYEKERELLVAFNKGEKQSTAIRNELVLHNLRFVVSVARGFGVTDNRVDTMDLIQEGNYGLVFSIPKYDIRRECRLCSYSLHWIKFFVRTLVSTRDFKNTVLCEEYPEILDEVDDAYHPAKHDLETFLRGYMTPAEAYVLVQHLCTYDSNDKNKTKNLEEIAVELRCTAMNVLCLRNTGLEKLNGVRDQFEAFIQETDHKNAKLQL